MGEGSCRRSSAGHPSSVCVTLACGWVGVSGVMSRNGLPGRRWLAADVRGGGAFGCGRGGTCGTFQH